MKTRHSFLRQCLLVCTLLGGHAWAQPAAPAPGTSTEPVTIFVAKKIVTMERSNPQALAVAVAGKRIISVGSMASVRAALRDRAYTVDDTFKDKVVMPGFIEQHMHPLLGALTLITEVIANDDWVLPGKTFKAATSPKEYRERLAAANKAMGEST
jgi:predicted amidohydrolase YtcJ